MIAPETVGADAAPASAQDAETLAAARSLAVEGVKLARAGYCAQAIDRLERAEALHHSSIVLAELGECYLRTGKVVGASEALRRVALEALPESPSPAQIGAQRRAAELLTQASNQIAQLTLEVQAHGPAGAIDPAATDGTPLVLSIDDQVVPRALIGAPRPTDPGRHSVRASAEGYLADEAEIDLAPGESQLLQLTLRPLPGRRAAALRSPRPKPVPATTTQPAGASQQRNWKKPAAYGLLAIGGAGIAAGLGFGGAAWTLKLRLDERCDGDSCPASSRHDLESAQGWGIASTVSLALGASSVVTGALLLLLARRDANGGQERRPWSIISGPAFGIGAQKRF